MPDGDAEAEPLLAPLLLCPQPSAASAAIDAAQSTGEEMAGGIFT